MRRPMRVLSFRGRSRSMVATLDALVLAGLTLFTMGGAARADTAPDYHCSQGQGPSSWSCPLWTVTPVYQRPTLTFPSDTVLTTIPASDHAAGFIDQCRTGYTYTLPDYGYSNAWWAQVQANGTAGWVSEVYFKGFGDAQNGQQDLPKRDCPAWSGQGQGASGGAATATATTTGTNPNDPKYCTQPAFPKPVPINQPVADGAIAASVQFNPGVVPSSVDGKQPNDGSCNDVWVQLTLSPKLSSPQYIALAQISYNHQPARSTAFAVPIGGLGLDPNGNPAPSYKYRDFTGFVKSTTDGSLQAVSQQGDRQAPTLGICLEEVGTDGSSHGGGCGQVGVTGGLTTWSQGAPPLPPLESSPAQSAPCLSSRGLESCLQAVTTAGLP